MVSQRDGAGPKPKPSGKGGLGKSEVRSGSREERGGVKAEFFEAVRGIAQDVANTCTKMRGLRQAFRPMSIDNKEGTAKPVALEANFDAPLFQFWHI